jgi:hypothetical protein
MKTGSPNGFHLEPNTAKPARDGDFQTSGTVSRCLDLANTGYREALKLVLSGHLHLPKAYRIHTRVASL